MKKFLIISTALILVSAIFFGFGLSHYIGSIEPEETQAPTNANTNNAVSTPTQTETDNTTQTTPMPSSWQDNGIFSANYDKAYTYVASMSKEQLIGQMLITNCPTDGTADSTLSKYNLSGYIYTVDNFYGMSMDEIKSTISTHKNGAKTPVLTAVTEEGGARTTVSDLDAFYEYSFASPRNTFEQGGMDSIKEAEQQKAQMLSSIGINLNLAPVCDMADESNQIMYSRSLGGTVEETSEFARTSTEAHQSKGVSVALKHFPGYGTNLDTYDPVVVDTREVSVFESTDLKPFESGISAGAHFVMMSNVLVQNLDAKCISSLSKTLHQTLRSTMKYTGLIMTDNLSNADYSQYANGNDVYVQAVLCGNDLIYTSDIDTAYNSILTALNSGTIKLEDLQKACTRIIAYKYTVGLMK